MKKNRILAGVVSTICLLTTNNIIAQTTKVKTVRNLMSADEKNITTAKYNIDLAHDHPQTNNSVDMWLWIGVVYAFIGVNQDTSIVNMDKDAAQKAGESFSKYFQFSEDERSDTKDEAKSYYPAAAVLCFNKGYQLSTEQGNFSKVKQYIGYAENILNNDKAALLAEMNLTLPKMYIIMLQSAQKDTLENEEINYLKKLIAIPKYFNAYVFVRLSEIYTKNKDFDKALEILAKGKEKIPSKAGDFLNAEISIEIDRNNIAALLTKFNEGIAHEPDNALYYYNRGTIYSMLKNKEIDNNIEPPKYYFKQGLDDFKKSLQLDPSNLDASFNEASLLVDSANFVYKLRSKFPDKYEFYDKLCKEIYRSALDKLELIRQTGSKKDSELIDMLKTMKSISSKLGDDESRKKYNTLYKEEEAKYNNSNQ